MMQASRSFDALYAAEAVSVSADMDNGAGRATRLQGQRCGDSVHAITTSVPIPDNPAVSFLKEVAKLTMKALDREACTNASSG
jgi:hypothetical protein